MKSYTIAAALALFSAAPAAALDIIGTVSKIVDGDTFDLRTRASCD
jgi:endonuclease YncB( thermonuclease family)